MYIHVSMPYSFDMETDVSKSWELKTESAMYCIHTKYKCNQIYRYFQPWTMSILPYIFLMLSLYTHELLTTDYWLYVSLFLDVLFSTHLMHDKAPKSIFEFIEMHCNIPVQPLKYKPIVRGLMVSIL